MGTVEVQEGLNEEPGFVRHMALMAQQWSDRLIGDSNEYLQ